ncbi:MAG: GspH/FimT family pseudopilin, partial [Bradyrhizobium sp.]
NMAILRSTPVAAVVDLDRSVVRLDLAEAAAQPSKPTEIKRSLGLRLVTADDQVLDHGVGRIVFFPDGSASGGGLRLLAGTKHVDVRVDWMTGAVHVTE